MRYIFLISMVAILFSCKSGDKKEKKETTSEPVRIDSVELLLRIPVENVHSVKDAWQWADKTGENILVLRAIIPDRDGDYASGKLQVTRLVEEDKKRFVETWDHYDSVDSCEFDATLAFIRDATTITDLDNDGIKEVIFLYRKACRSDVSPAAMKLVMHEGSTKYSLKGYSWLRASLEDSFTVTEQDVNLETLPNYKPDEDYMMTAGRYESEKEFAQAPPEFLIYARQQWMKFVKERME